MLTAATMPVHSASPPETIAGAACQSADICRPFSVTCRIKCRFNSATPVAALAALKRGEPIIPVLAAYFILLESLHEITQSRALSTRAGASRPCLDQGPQAI